MERGLVSDDPETRSMVLDLFTEITILEHLIRERFNPNAADLDPRQFGVLNYLVRQKKVSEKLPILAWCFQVEEPLMAESVAALERLKFVEIDWVNGERCVFLTDAGRARHEAFIEVSAPDVIEILADFDPEQLRTTTDTLRELRRTFDNLPDR